MVVGNGLEEMVDYGRVFVGGVHPRVQGPLGREVTFDRCDVSTLDCHGNVTYV